MEEWTVNPVVVPAVTVAVPGADFVAASLLHRIFTEFTS